MPASFYRIAEIARPRGVFSTSKLYKDAAAGLIQFKKIGGMTVVDCEEYVRYLEGRPVVHRSRHAEVR